MSEGSLEAHEFDHLLDLVLDEGTDDESMTLEKAREFMRGVFRDAGIEAEPEFDEDGKLDTSGLCEADIKALMDFLRVLVEDRNEPLECYTRPG